ncbi:MAG: type VI secretion system ATPase TssH [Acidobacteria bacterium]|nr:type VI secretion system ATPase TssH [Acidobacteriota bacterium]
MSLNVKALIGKLNPEARGVFGEAAGLAAARTHFGIEIEHYLLKLLETTDTNAERILRHYGVNTSRFAKELAAAIDRFKSGSGRNPAFDPDTLEMIREAWTLGSLDYGASSVGTGLTLMAVVQHEELRRRIYDISREFQKIEPDLVRKDFLAIVQGSGENELGYGAASGEEGTAGAPEPLRRGSKTPNLDQYTVNLTENARQGKIDPVLGRDSEIRQVVDILMRRRQNNPILTGEAGVGKTAIVEGFASRIAQGEVPPPLRNVTLRTLDLALLQAGAGVKGEFENRLKGLIEEVKASPTPIILFIDEAHTMIGAGGQAGQNDAANLLKPALARGELRTIAATTWSEYKKYFEKDPALARRFQVVKVDEPTETVCAVMLRGVVPSLEKHHTVRILEEGLEAAVRLSHRYLAGRQLPDKAVSVLDTACARLALGQHSIPAALEETTRRLDDLNVQERVLTREMAVGADHSERLESIRELKRETEARLADLQARFEKERDLVTRIRELRTQLESAVLPETATAAAAAAAPAGTPAPESGIAEPVPQLDELRASLIALDRELAQLQGESPMMRVCVDAQIVSQVISNWTGIPVGSMLKDEISTVLTLEDHLERRVIGQRHALHAIAQRIRTSRARLEDPNKPIGVFMLAGPSGVGKTETALALADLLYGGERNLITINMSEFQEAHTVSTLKGSPPGYVGYGEGGVLTEAVRRRPYSVVLLDEVEKAHPDVLELFFQVFDKGMMEDGEGREIDFKNTVIILTTNAGTDQIARLTADPETAPGSDGIVKAIKPELNKVFKPAFLGRLVIVPYYPIRDEAMKQIILLKLRKIQKRILENHKTELVCGDPLVEEVARRCTEVESGARNVDNILTNTMLPEISRQILGRLAEGGQISRIEVSVGVDGQFVYV